MKNWLKKCSVALLIFSMIGTTMPVYAADAPAAKTQTTTEDQTEEQKSEVQAEESQVEEPQQQEQTSEEQQSVDENVEGEQDVQEQEAPEQETTEQEAQPEESSMNYAYVESPYLQTPETQRIVVSWGTEDEYIEQMVLHVRKDDDTWEDWCISRSEGNLYLFEKYYEDEYQSGTYEVVSISVTENGETTDYALADLKMEAKFGVNQEYDGIDELQPVDEEQEEAAAEDAAGISVSTLNEDGTIEEQNSIEDALDAARTDVLASTPAMMSLDDDSGISTHAARSGKIVVALDPGHDDRDAGASDYGLHEEALTLKIANYCKEELEKYAGVEVYMTRTSSKCPYPNASPAGGCITARANAAAKAGAKIFVSFHLNAWTDPKSNGAEVIIPNYNWKSDVGAQGRELASKILNELTSLGLCNRGLVCKTGTDPKYKYPDGSLEDWFTVQVANKYNGIPGIIVEHAFITNSGDVNNVLNTEAGLKRLGVADATGIANYLGLSKEKVEWKTVNGKKYCYVNNQKITGERQIGGYWYYFDGNGVMQTGFVNLGGKTVYYNSDGQMQYGEQKINNAWYYFDTITGARITGFYNLPGKTVYYGSDGQMRYGEQKINNAWYYFDTTTGARVTGFYNLSGRIVYYGADGKMRYGEQKINNAWYCFDTITGARVTGFYNLSGKIYYYGTDGKKRFGEQKINDAWYCFDTSTGKMVTGFYNLPGKVVYYGADGKMLYGEQKIGNYYYYFDPVFGSMYTGWRTVNKKTKYYQNNGHCTTGEYQIDNRWYYFDKNGTMQTGFVQLPGKTVYYNGSGAMQYGEQKINNAWYYFDMITGKMATGFCELPGKWVYYGSNGKMLYGEQKIGNCYYYFDPVFGSMYSGWKTVNGKTRYYQSNGQGKTGEYCENGKWYYFDKNGIMQKGFVQLPEKTVYYNGNGVMQYGEQKINDAWYYFDMITGKMATGFCELPGKWVYYGSNGKMLYGEQKIGNYYYYFDPVFGSMYSGWKTVNGKARYYQSNGQGKTGEYCENGKWYYFDKNGVMQKGFVQLPEKTVYYNGNGVMQYGEQKINNAWYYFDTITGKMATGFYNLPGKIVYYGADGKMLYKEQKIGNYYYYFDAVTGAMVKNATINGHYYDNTGKRVEKQQEASHLIVNNPTTNVAQMVQFYKNTGKTYPAEKLKKGGAESIEKFASIYYEEATAEGVDPAVAWCQSMKETGWLQFGGQVKIEQFNFAGLGATDNGASGADFSKYGENGVRMGVRAQIQHLKAYAVSGLTEKNLKYACVDPRFRLVNKGSAKYVEWLGTHENPIGAGWATGVDYGPGIIKLMNQLEK